ncbi:hypothetical protein [Thioclava atlantica]|uniref:Uncharacterized protein n=1 Tax=Thioclava atlantica TaxID=1317124 RepID=A0A085TRY8_9RHOB|nr:hypothetical protein [Thioclava atlantica]KFE33485.1 hypothetical protein DW2_17452 [Thioclava atlantica]
MFHQMNPIDDVISTARAALEALDVLPPVCLFGTEEDRNFFQEIVTRGEVLGEDFRDCGASLLRHLARVEPDEEFERNIDTAIRQIRDAINGSYCIAGGLANDCEPGILRAA